MTPEVAAAAAALSAQMRAPQEAAKAARKAAAAWVPEGWHPPLILTRRGPGRTAPITPGRWNRRAGGGTTGRVSRATADRPSGLFSLIQAMTDGGWPMNDGAVT